MDFATMAKSMGLKNDAGLMAQAKAMWEMLDDMAATNPAAYDAFQKNQEKEKG